MTARVIIWCALGLTLARCVCACAHQQPAPVHAPPPAYGNRVV